MQKRELVQFLLIGFKIGQRHACELIGLNRSTYYCQSQAEDQTALKIRIRDIAGVRVRYGYRRIHVMLQREGWEVNHKRVYRLYRQDGLSLRLKTKKKKRAASPRVAEPDAIAPNDRWSMDFVADRLANGKAFRILTLVDNFSRVSPAIGADFKMSGRQVTEVLDRAVVLFGLPKAIQVDNGSEFAGKELDAWAYRNKVRLCFSRPGKPTLSHACNMDNAYIESFNGKFRNECLSTHWFESLDEAQTIIEEWRKEYNTERPSVTYL